MIQYPQYSEVKAQKLNFPQNIMAVAEAVNENLIKSIIQKF